MSPPFVALAAFVSIFVLVLHFVSFYHGRSHRHEITACAAAIPTRRLTRVVSAISGHRPPEAFRQQDRDESQHGRGAPARRRGLAPLVNDRASHCCCETGIHVVKYWCVYRETWQTEFAFMTNYWRDLQPPPMHGQPQPARDPAQKASGKLQASPWMHIILRPGILNVHVKALLNSGLDSRAVFCFGVRPFVCFSCGRLRAVVARLLEPSTSSRHDCLL